MASQLLIHKCTLCGRWNSFENDTECECGHRLSFMSDEEDSQTIDLTRAVQILEALEKAFGPANALSDYKYGVGAGKGRNY